MVFVPNTFTPNGDSKNEGFRAYGMDVQDFDFWIFDRWGELIWHSQSMDQPWDGTYQGTLVEDGVYVWKIRCYDSSDDPHEFYGHVTVLK